MRKPPPPSSEGTRPIPAPCLAVAGLQPCRASCCHGAVQLFPTVPCTTASYHISSRLSYISSRVKSRGFHFKQAVGSKRLANGRKQARRRDGVPTAGARPAHWAPRAAVRSPPLPGPEHHLPRSTNGHAASTVRCDVTRARAVRSHPHPVSHRACALAGPSSAPLPGPTPPNERAAFCGAAPRLAGGGVESVGHTGRPLSLYAARELPRRRQSALAFSATVLLGLTR